MANPLAKTLVEYPAPAPAPRPPVDRERLLNAMIDLCEVEQGVASPEAHALMEDVFLDLMKRTERDMRLRLADRLAAAPWAPSGLINALALDDIEIARPVIAKSPVLNDQDLIRVLTIATIEHQIEVARRPELGAAVVKAILDQGDPAVMTTLAGNERADMSGETMLRLVAASRKIAALRAPLSRHPNLNLELACALYTWVGDALKGEIVSRFQIDEKAFDKAFRASMAEYLSGSPPPGAPAKSHGETEHQEMERRLISKLEAAGQLRPSFLLRALREGKLYLFEVALASLAGVKIEAVRAAINCDQPELLALACVGIGIDRSVFPTILSLVRALNDTRPEDSPDSVQKINLAFGLGGAAEAVAAFRAGVGGLASV